MKKYIFIYAFISLCIFTINAQDRNQSILLEGKCIDIISGLRESYKNDTLVVEFLKNHYTIQEAGYHSSVLNKDVPSFINFFQTTGKDWHCYFRGLKENKALLIK
ncbi:MAG: hypothetical protein E6772_03120 [Dysgonomonas sp.]|nr:hypothetical protein [Dysgonomonas sp.]